MFGKLIFSVLLGWCIVIESDAHVISNRFQCFLPNAKESLCKPYEECPTLVEAFNRNKQEGKTERAESELAKYACKHAPELVSKFILF